MTRVCGTVISILGKAWCYFFDTRKWSAVQALILMQREREFGLRSFKLGEIAQFIRKQSRYDDRFRWAKRYASNKRFARFLGDSYFGAGKEIRIFRASRSWTNGLPFIFATARNRLFRTRRRRRSNGVSNSGLSQDIGYGSVSCFSRRFSSSFSRRPIAGCHVRTLCGTATWSRVSAMRVRTVSIRLGKLWRSANEAKNLLIVPVSVRMIASTRN